MEFYLEKIFPSKKGLHLEFKKNKDAELYYQQGLKLGNRVEIHENIVIMLNSKAYQNHKNKPNI